MLPANALRLGSLVAAAMASGYLWRAALEPRGATKVLRVSSPSAGFRVPGTLVNPFARLPLVHGEAARSRAASKPPGRQAATKARRAGTDVLIVRTTRQRPRPRAGSASGRTRNGSRHRQTPRPGPAPRPAPPVRRPTPPPPPPPAPPPPPPPAQQPPAQPPPPPPVTRPGDRQERGSRPGWGRGDKNHEHTGPPGQQKEKKGNKK